MYSVIPASERGSPCKQFFYWQLNPCSSNPARISP